MIFCGPPLCNKDPFLLSATGSLTRLAIDDRRQLGGQQREGREGANPLIRRRRHGDALRREGESGDHFASTVTPKPKKAKSQCDS